MLMDSKTMMCNISLFNMNKKFVEEDHKMQEVAVLDPYLLLIEGMVQGKVLVSPEI